MKKTGQKSDSSKNGKEVKEYLVLERYSLVVASPTNMNNGYPPHTHVTLYGRPETTACSVTSAWIYFGDDAVIPPQPSFSNKCITMHLQKWQLPQVIEIVRNGKGVKCAYIASSKGISTAILFDQCTKTSLGGPLSEKELNDLLRQPGR